jgi:hypothetical protein
MAADLVIIRPAGRCARLQLVIMLALGVVGTVLAWTADGPSGGVLAGAIAGVGLLGARRTTRTGSAGVLRARWSPRANSSASSTGLASAAT